MSFEFRVLSICRYEKAGYIGICEVQLLEIVLLSVIDGEICVLRNGAYGKQEPILFSTAAIGVEQSISSK